MIDEIENILLLKNLHYCSKCRNIRSLEDNFCGTCGTKLTGIPSELINRRCARCNNPLDIIDYFCPTCGLKQEEI